MPAPQTPLPGGWNPTRTIGHGAFAVVLEGRGPTGQRVAIKIPHSEHPQTLARFRREVAVMQALPDNRHLVGLLDHGELPSGDPFLVMEYIDGVTLRDILASGALSQSSACELMCQVCEAVGQLHQLGTSHGDIKPANVMMARDPKPMAKLLDFGLVRDCARVLEHMERDLVLPTSAFGQELDAGQVMGTPEYLAPETLTGSADPSADVYGLGVILAELLTGKPLWPFAPTAKSREENIYQTRVYLEARTSIDGRDIPCPPGVSDSLWFIVQRCLARRPEDRYAHALEMRDDLRRFENGPVSTIMTFRDPGRLAAARVIGALRS